MTIDHEIKRVIKNWIRQEPGPYRFIIINENIIDLGERRVGKVS